MKKLWVAKILCEEGLFTKKFEVQEDALLWLFKFKDSKVIQWGLKRDER